VTVRARADIPSLRDDAVFPAVRSALKAASKPAFRVTQYSVQSDHVHLVVEGADKTALALGLRGLVIRAARAINRALGRDGSVWADRYHARALTTLREVRQGLSTC
jgi:putative transposase